MRLCAVKGEDLMNRGIEKEKNKSHQTLNQKNINDLSITVYEDENVTKQFTKAVNWLKRYVIKPTYDFTKKEDAKQALTWASGKYQQLELLSNRGWSRSKLDYYGRLMRSFGENQSLTHAQYLKNALPVRVQLSHFDNIKVAWTSLNDKNTSHGRKGKLLKQTEFDFELMWDFQTLLAETKLYNLLYEFILSQIHILEEEVVKYCYAIQKNKDCLLVPKEEEFQKDFIKVAKRCLKVSRYQVDADRDRFKTYFNGKNIKNPLVMGWTLYPFLQTFGKVKVEKKKRKQPKRTAKVYETNQNIKSEVSSVMKDNAFLANYGEVELHNSIDLAQFKQLEKDFNTLKAHIHIPICKDYSFRIKKLGNHRASGLHYEGAKSVILNVGNPSAYTHELGHQIDSVYGKTKKMSSSVSFRPILSKYTTLVQTKVRDLTPNDAFYHQWFGRGKYNQHYYLEKQEVFARCFELYVDAVAPKTLLTSKKLHSYVYPKDDLFVQEIIRYFEGILSKN